MPSPIPTVCRCRAIASTCSVSPWSSSVDVEKFQCLQLAYESIRKGGNMPCIVNAANEIVNLAFREGRCSFLGMGEVIEKTMQRATFDAKPDYEVYLQTDAEARRLATELLTE